MKNVVKHLKKLKLRAKMQHTIGQFVAIFKFWSGHFQVLKWPISDDVLGQFLIFISGNPAMVASKNTLGNVRLRS